jgi:protease I
MELSGKKVIIPVEQMFNDLEFWYPYYRLKEAGADLTVVGSGSAEEYFGKSGTSIKVDANADQVNVSESIKRWLWTEI